MQRTGDLVIEWGEELEAQYRALEKSQPATSTLVKRPAPSAKEIKEEPASKKAKTEELEDIKAHYEKGTLNKVRSIPGLTKCRIIERLTQYSI